VAAPLTAQDVLNPVELAQSLTTTLGEVAALSQKLHQLVAQVSQGSALTGEVTLSPDAFELSSEAVGFLAAMGGVEPEVILKNLYTLQDAVFHSYGIVQQGDVLKIDPESSEVDPLNPYDDNTPFLPQNSVESSPPVPGVLGSLAQLLGTSPQEAWGVMEYLSDGEADRLLSSIPVLENAPFMHSPVELGLAGAAAMPAVKDAPQGRAAAPMMAEVTRKPSLTSAPALDVAEKSARPLSADQNPSSPRPAREMASIVPPAATTVAAIKESPKLTAHVLTTQAELQPAATFRLPVMESAAAPVTARREADTESELAFQPITSRELSAEGQQERSERAEIRKPLLPMRDQLVLKMRQNFAQGETQFKLQLAPVELGRVQITLEIDAEQMARVMVIAENPETLDLLQRDSKALAKALADTGLELSDKNMSFDLEQQSQRDFDEAEDRTTAPVRMDDEFETELSSAVAEDDLLLAQVLLDQPGSQTLYYTAPQEGLNVKI